MLIQPSGPSPMSIQECTDTQPSPPPFKALCNKPKPRALLQLSPTEENVISPKRTRRFAPPKRGKKERESHLAEKGFLSLFFMEQLFVFLPPPFLQLS
ncbi:hypothetical protein TNIN_194871 [Trichonephila inaurata madagascariensis]|uniref:Uncharacterized protein n=1 Tax=Trichonephila inaurata madagascariensis TaxID=2747483 RepID=A0A8X6YS03_9ARAC|nr:hypothetical protein TNIN_194871 [Trichonephila inaurata madagascariensis]